MTTTEQTRALQRQIEELAPKEIGTGTKLAGSK
jgi:hypothetical protein